MKSLFILLALGLGLAHGLDRDSVRVRFGTTQEEADIEHFFEVFKYERDARSAGWSSIRRPATPNTGLTLLCPSDRHVCGLYGRDGFIAGLQIAFPVEDLEMEIIPAAQHLVRWRPPTWPWQRTREYWATTIYFDDPANATTRPAGQTVGPGGVWVVGPGGNLIHMPHDEKDYASTAFKKQSCVHFMGQHYFYNMTNELNCPEFTPWFSLTHHGNLVGCGFLTFAKLPLPAAGDRDWFERPNEVVARVIAPDGPDCLYDWAKRYGLLSLHVYFVDEPWKILCDAQ